MTFTYRCDLPVGNDRSGKPRTISCVAPGARIAFGEYGRGESAVDAHARAEWARSWETALSDLREVVEALK